ncbi:MAG: hypothetical protein LBM20_06045 [Rikenellaceae bacterium]|jgi:uncharacterized protein involved in exopolysaccharide biosynthesis|nr:hypothetical protein [Rikenellaceae bacterium]
MTIPERETFRPEPDLAEWLRLCWRARRSIALCALCTGLLAAGVALVLPKAYTVTVKMAGESRRTGMSPDLSGQSLLMGVDPIALRPEEPVPTDLYPEIVVSTPFLAEFSHLQVDGKPLSAYVQGFRQKSVRKEASAPTGAIPPRLLECLRKSLTIYTDKKSGLTTLSVTLTDPLVAAVAADSLATRLERYLIDWRTRKAREDFSFVQERFAEAQADYFAAQEAYARFSDANQHTARQSAAIERDRLYQAQQLVYTLYAQLAGQLEAARIAVQEQTPAFSIIEPAIVPARHSSPRRSLIVLIGLLSGIVIPMIVLFGRLFLREKGGVV